VRTSVGEECGGSTASIAAQGEAIEAHAAREGIEIVEIFHEPKVSGDKLMRPEFERMMDSATSAERPVDQIIVYNLTRFSRHLTARIASEQRLTQAQIRLISVTENFSQDAVGS
jgi:DNA invertase Pin-like site-specific DNA recombinase